MTAVRRTPISLADGRDLIHFDRPGADERRTQDPRHLPQRGEGPLMRRDPLLDEWVSIAAHRQDRTFLPAADQCPLCPSRDGHQTEIPSNDYDVVVFENRFPSFWGDTRDGLATADESPAGGRCEVVCFTPEHDASFRDLTIDRAELGVAAWIDRPRALSLLESVRQVFIFENRGEAIGVTMRHPHGQIYAYPFVTPRSRQQLATAAKYKQSHGENLYDAVVAAELAEGTRVILESTHWVAFVPFAARWPIEVHLYPRRRVPDFAALKPDEVADLAKVYLDLLIRADDFYGTPLPYIAAWHQAPVRAEDGRADGALLLELFSVQRTADKLKFLAGSESAMGAFVNDRDPEGVALRFRELSTAPVKAAARE